MKLVVPQTWQHRGLRSHQQPLEPSLQDCPQPHATLHALHAPPSPVARLVKGATGAASQATCRPVTTSPGPHEYVSCSRRAHGRAAVTACCNVRALQGKQGARVTSVASQPRPSHIGGAPAAHAHEAVQELAESRGHVADAAHEGQVCVLGALPREHLRIGGAAYRVASIAHQAGLGVGFGCRCTMFTTCAAS